MGFDGPGSQGRYDRSWGGLAITTRSEIPAEALVETAQDHQGE